MVFADFAVNGVMLKELLGFLLSRPSHALRARRARGMLASGAAYQRSGDHVAAREALERAVALDPHNAMAHFQLGTLMARTDPYPACARHLERAVALEPVHHEWWMALGELAHRQLDHAKATACYRVALASAPASIPARRGLGRVLRETGRVGEAIIHLRRAYAQAPEAPGALGELVSALVETDACDRALSVAAEALERDRSSYEANLWLGFAYQKLHDPERALAHYDIAQRINPGAAELYDLRGSTYQELGRLDEAFADYERALALRPGFPLALFHRAMARLLVRDFERGWDDYELRRLNAAPRASALPAWDGSALGGRTILVYREQGLGDEIMFASILPELIRMAGHCIIECDPRLLPIFSRSFPAATIFASIPGGGLPYRITRRPTDVEIGAGSLARFLRRKASDFPRHDGYLKADPARVNRWHERLAQLGPGLKVGIAWTGGVRKTRRGLRSLALEQLLPLLRIPGARFVSLQYTGAAADETAALEARHGIRVEHWSEAIDDYEETAALVCALDLVISVCTALVHLSGALGTPAWVMAPYSPEWRYGFRGETMPWYPSVRIFRQPAYGRWETVIGAVADQLHRAAGPPGR